MLWFIFQPLELRNSCKRSQVPIKRVYSQNFCDINEFIRYLRVVKQIGKHLMNSLIVVKKSNLKWIKQSREQYQLYMFCVYFSCWYCVQHILTFVSLFFFLLFFCVFFFMLAIQPFFASLAKKPQSFFPGNLDFGRVGEKEKNVGFSWWAVCDFKECENFKGWDTCSTKLYYFLLDKKQTLFWANLSLFSL